MELSHVYCIENLVNGKQYIGVSKSVDKRWHNHKTSVKYGSTLIHRAICKYGVDNFKFEVIDILPTDEAFEMEILLIKFLKTQVPNGYNIAEGGNRCVLKGSNNGNAKSVTVNGKEYGCIKDAAMDLGVNAETLRRHVRAKGTNIHYVLYDSARRSKVNARKSPSEATKEVLREKAIKRHKNSKHPRNQKVMVNGTKYESIKDAAVAESINYSTLKYRFQSYSKTGKWPRGYSYLS